MDWEKHFDGQEFELFEAKPNNPKENGLHVGYTKFKIKKKQNGSWILKGKKHMDGWTPGKTRLFADEDSTANDFRLYGILQLNGSPHSLMLKEHKSGAKDEICFEYRDLTNSVSPGGTGGGRR